MKNNIFFIFLLYILAMLTSCNNTILPIRIPTGDPSIPQNNIIKEIPRYPENNKVYLFYKLAKQKQKQLALSVPENGHNGLLMRIWFTYPKGLYQYGELLEININEDDQAGARYTKMDIFFNPTRDFEQINSHNDSTITEPQNGWNNFSNKLKELDIVNLPTIEDIPEYRNHVDGLGYGNDYLTVACEIATEDKYRFIQYNDLEGHKNVDQVGRMYEFIKFIRNEFNMHKISDKWYGQ